MRGATAVTFAGSPPNSRRRAHLPNDVQATRCFSEYTHEYVWLLMRRDGSRLVEGRAAEDAEALAIALLGYLEKTG